MGGERRDLVVNIGFNVGGRDGEAVYVQVRLLRCWPVVVTAFSTVAVMSSIAITFLRSGYNRSCASEMVECSLELIA
jgi:hypothetical protein